MNDHVKSPGTKADDIPDSAITTDPDEARLTEEDTCRQIRKRFDTMFTFWSRIHEKGLEDDGMVTGDGHWPQQIRQEREDDRRPILTYNMIPAFNRQITNKMRQDDRSLRVAPVETNRGADPRMKNMTGTKDYSLADVYAGVWKNIEHVSRADQAYDTAAKHAVDHGFGYFYLMPQWSKIDPFVQELVLHRVKNSYSILLDPDAQEADYRDAQDGFIFSDVNKNTFKRKWPKARFADFSTTGGSTYQGWFSEESARIAQYLWISYEDDEALMLSNGKVVYLSDVESVLDDIEKETGVHVARRDNGDDMRKAVKRPICNWQKMTANEILEGPLDLPFSTIPIFPVLGEEVMLAGEVRYESAHRHAHDAQRSYNYWRTAAAETVALAPKAPWMLTDRQLDGHEDLFEQANTSNLPYLTYNHQEGVPPPTRNYPAHVAAAELQNATQDGIDMQTIIGLHDASLGRESNEKSGKAILARQDQGNTATFQFPDNLSRAMEQAGRCAVEAIPRLYDSRRIIRIRLPDGEDDFIEINQSVTDGETNQEILVHDIAYGKYDVRMETGPSYATQRQEAAELQIDLLKVLGPDQARNIVHLVVQNLGVPGSEEVAKVLRKMLPDSLKSEEEKMADLPAGVVRDPRSGQLIDADGKPWQPVPTLDQQIQMKANEIEELKAEAEIAKHAAVQDKAAADTKKAEADLRQAELDLAKLQAGGEEPGAAKVPDGFMDSIQGIIENTMREHSMDPGAHDAMDIEGKIADAMVDALKRVRAYVDRQVDAGSIEPADAPVDKKPTRLRITDGGDGSVVVEPEYDNDDTAE